MIFITVGTQEPFDRFMKALDKIVPELGGEEIVAQVVLGEYTPKNFKTFPTMSPKDFASAVERARVIIAHCGMGTIISAMQANKPLIVFPRDIRYHEHRNDHQLATARYMQQRNWVYVANDSDELRSLLTKDLQPLHKLGSSASPELVNFIRDL